MLDAHQIPATSTPVQTPAKLPSARLSTSSVAPPLPVITSSIASTPTPHIPSLASKPPVRAASLTAKSSLLPLLGHQAPRYKKTLGIFLKGQISRREFEYHIREILNTPRLIRLHNHFIVSRIANARRPHHPGTSQSASHQNHQKHSDHVGSEKDNGIRFLPDGIPALDIEKATGHVPESPMNAVSIQTCDPYASPWSLPDRTKRRRLQREQTQKSFANMILSMRVSDRERIRKIPKRTTGLRERWRIPSPFTCPDIPQNHLRDYYASLYAPTSVRLGDLPSLPGLKERMMTVALEQNIVAVTDDAVAYLHKALQTFVKNIVDGCLRMNTPEGSWGGGSLGSVFPTDSLAESLPVEPSRQHPRPHPPPKAKLTTRPNSGACGISGALKRPYGLSDFLFAFTVAPHNLVEPWLAKEAIWGRLRIDDSGDADEDSEDQDLANGTALRLDHHPGGST